MSQVNQESGLNPSIQEVTNTSGQGSAASVPQEIRHWNWGAFLLSWVWGLFHHVWWSLLALVPYVGFIVAIILGINGSEAAWQAQHYNSIEEFKARERRWKIAGIVLGVIPIILILVSSIILVMNPVELLKKARDSQRLSDVNALRTAISYYVTESSKPVLGSAKYYYVSNNVNPGITCAGRIAKVSGSQATDGNGWIPIDFTSMTDLPLEALPSDPIAGDKNFYVYLVDPTTNQFELITNMESSYYSKGGRGDVESTDGGLFPDLYEVGTEFIATPENCPLD